MTKTVTKDGSLKETLQSVLKDVGAKKLLVVHDAAFRSLNISQEIESADVEKAYFDDFQPNPWYESVVEGVRVFRENRCDAILAVGGGSAMDVAKCIKLYANMDEGADYALQPVVPNGIPLIAVPTTAGTGSEATRFAVIYRDGEKLPVTDDSIVPGYVILCPGVLKTLPDYQRKSTMLDALCHAVESYWSVNSDARSREYSAQAIRDILCWADGYLANTDEGNAGMLMAANLAGKAINITQTTAGHAMCYKLTSLYGIAHGHAAALCVDRLWPYMLAHTSDCVDTRGEAYLRGVFSDLASAFGCAAPAQAAEKFHSFTASLGLKTPVPQEGDYDVLAVSVNPGRLKNNPVLLDRAALEALYREILP